MPSRFCGSYFSIEPVDNVLNGFLVRVGNGHYALSSEVVAAGNTESAL